MEKITVIGGGAWGTALAALANRAGRKVTLLTRNQSVIDSILRRNMNEAYLPGVYLDPGIHPTADVTEACLADLVILATPSQVVRNAAIDLSDHLPAEIPLVIASKGIERGSLLLMSEVVAGALPANPLSVLSGPSFAHEAAGGLPTAITLACHDRTLGEKIIRGLGSSRFRPYLAADVIGAQIGGAVKNVIALACGIAVGCGYGENARSALITRGLAEITRLCKAKGGKAETLMGLCGVGDLILTCTSLQSRNFSFGHRLGQGEGVDTALSRQRGVTEGVITAQSVTGLAKRLGIEMPICQEINSVLYEGKGVEAAVASLLDRPYRREAET